MALDTVDPNNTAALEKADAKEEAPVAEPAVLEAATSAAAGESEEGEGEAEGPQEMDPKKALQNKDFERALELYGLELQKQVEAHGEEGEPCAKAYFDYAHALIKKAEGGMDLFGGAVEKAEQDKEGGAGAGGGEGGEEAAPGEDDADDLQIAWENLEMARRIYETSKTSPLELARVYLALGDVSQLGENFEQSISDYKKCIALREEHCEPHDRRIADVHSAIALSYGYAKPDDAEYAACHLQHERKTLECLEACLKHNEQHLKAIEGGCEVEGDGKELSKEEIVKEIEELKEIIPAVQEGIDAAAEAPQTSVELKAHFENQPAEKTPPAPQTTTGFGGFAMPSATAVSAPVTTLQARSKRKAVDAGSQPAKMAKPEDKQAALMARMGGDSGGATTFGF